VKLLITGLTLTWLALLAGFAWWLFGLGMEGWSDQHSNSGVHRPGYQRDVALAGGGFLSILPGGPVVIAMVAYVKGRRGIGTFFLTLAGVAAVTALTVYRLN